MILKYALTEVNSQYVVNLGFDPEWIMCFHSALLHSSLEKLFNIILLFRNQAKTVKIKKKPYEL